MLRWHQRIDVKINTESTGQVEERTDVTTEIYHTGPHKIIECWNKLGWGRGRRK
jgi:hypothetical protein